MNLIIADFNWISFVLIIVAGIIGMIKSNARKSRYPSAPLDLEVYEEEETEKKYGCEEERERKEIQVPTDNDFSEEIVLKKERPDCSVMEEDEEEYHSQFDIRQAIISSEILKRPEF